MYICIMHKKTVLLIKILCVLWVFLPFRIHNYVFRYVLSACVSVSVRSDGPR